jgi:predicted extracellular nuclease
VDTAAPGGVFDPVGQGTDFWESLEGMRITAEGVRATSPFLSNFGEIVVTPTVGANPSDNARGGLTIRDTTPEVLDPALKVFDPNPERLQIDDEAGIATPTGIQVGDRLGDVTGVVGYDRGFYELNPTAAYTVTPANNPREVTTIAGSLDRVRSPPST